MEPRFALRFALRCVFLMAACLGPAYASTAPAVNDRVDALYADAHAAEASGDLAGATAKYQQILKLQPRLAPAYNNLGAVYVKQGQWQNAVAILQRGLELNPNMTSASALLGMSLYQLGEYAKAKAPLEAVVKANPSDFHAEFFLVNDLTKLGEFNAAAVHLQNLAQRQPGNGQVWYLLGKVYMQLSEQSLAKVNQIDPDSVWAHEISAELMENMKNYDSAIVEWKKAEAKAPRQPGVHFKLGDLYWSLSQWDEAARQFEAERTIDPANCRVTWKLGNILLQKGEQFEEALNRIDGALRSCPNLMDARADRGRILMKLHREQEAVPELQAAAQANPDEPSNHFLLAQAYRVTGHAAEAQSEMQLFSDLEQKSRSATAERAREVIHNSQNSNQ